MPYYWIGGVSGGVLLGIAGIIWYHLRKRIPIKAIMKNNPVQGIQYNVMNKVLTVKNQKWVPYETNETLPEGVNPLTYVKRHGMIFNKPANFPPTKIEV